ncbi:unnamed protein product, partial [Meganyctiphanes norvegica]
IKIFISLMSHISTCSLDIPNYCLYFQLKVTQVLPFNNSAASGVREVVLPLPNINDVMSSVFNDGTIGFMKFSSKVQSEMYMAALTSDEFIERRKQHFDVVLLSEWLCYGSVHPDSRHGYGDLRLCSEHRQLLLPFLCTQFTS